MRTRTVLTCWAALAFGATMAAAQVPQLRAQGTATQLVVDGKPFLVRAGEVARAFGARVARPFWVAEGAAEASPHPCRSDIYSGAERP
jgi:hypothetical protein